MTGIETLRQWLNTARRAAFLGGAGVPSPSGEKTPPPDKKSSRLCRGSDTTQKEVSHHIKATLREKNLLERLVAPWHSKQVTKSG